MGNDKIIRKFHSNAQRLKCLKLVETKQMSQAQFDEMDRATPKHTPLPERKAPKK
jgi:hypothetical protein